MGPMSNPWHGPTKPGFFAGLAPNEDTAYLGPVAAALGSGAAKAASAAADLARGVYASQADLLEAVHLPSGSARFQEQAAASAAQEAHERVKALTPDPTTTGTAVQIVHGLGEGAYLATVGGLLGGVSGAAVLTGGSEGASRFHELSEEGVSPGPAAASAGVTALASGAGVLIPGGFGSTLATRLLTGAVINPVVGIAQRYTDHKILESAGYPEMAAQQKVWDSTQVITDLLLGTAFGGLAHLHGREEMAVKAAANEPGMTDAALTTNLAVHDRAAAPGIPVDPAASDAHQRALDTATNQLLTGAPHNISQTGVNDARFVPRPVNKEQHADAQAIARDYVPPEPMSPAQTKSPTPAGEEGAAVAGPSQKVIDQMRAVWAQAETSPAAELAHAEWERNPTALSEPIDPTEANIGAHIDQDPDAPIGGFIDTKTGQVHFDDIKRQAAEAGAVRLPTENLGEANGGRTRADGQAEVPRTGAAAEGETGGQAASAGPAGAAAGSSAGRTAGESGLADTVHAALQERPNLEITADDGKPIAAADALRQANEEAAREMGDFQKAVMAATNCFGRRGA